MKYSTIYALYVCLRFFKINLVILAILSPGLLLAGTSLDSLPVRDWRQNPPPLVKEFKEIEPLFKKYKTSDTTYVINFWATWCKPCVEELPFFEELGNEYADQPVKVILISLDFENQRLTKLQPFLEKKKLRNEVIHFTDPDSSTWIDAIYPEWSGALPATYIFHRDKWKFYEKSFSHYVLLEQEVKRIMQ